MTMTRLSNATCFLGLVLLSVAVAGCEERRTLTDRQVDELLSMPAEATRASRELVAHDAKSREQWLSLHSAMQAELQEIGRRQEQLEVRRQELARQRRTDPILAEALHALGAALLCLLPVAVIALLLWPRRPSESQEICEFLIDTVTAQQHQVRRLEARHSDER